jgi:hypothetical protein
VTIRWQTVGDRVRYFVDDAPVESFDDVLDRVAAGPDEPVTLQVSELGLGGEDLVDSLPFGERMAELEDRLGERELRYKLF